MNQHVTPDLATLTDFAPYLGNDYLHVGDGKGHSISHIGHTMLRSPKRTFTFSIFLILPNYCYLFKKIIMIIMFILNLGLVYMDEKLRHRLKTFMKSSRFKTTVFKFKWLQQKRSRNLSCSPDNIQCSAHNSSSRSPNELIPILFES